jgi:hypothetical protein
MFRANALDADVAWCGLIQPRGTAMADADADEILKIFFYKNRRDLSGIWVPEGEPFPEHEDRAAWLDPIPKWIRRGDLAPGNLEKAMLQKPPSESTQT